MKENVLISAYNINAGGGLLLLKGLLKTLPSNTKLVVFADKRLKDSDLESISGDVKIYFVKQTLLARIWAEFQMTRMSKDYSSHFCLGNLPPLFGSHSRRVTIYLHTRYIVDQSIDHLIPLRKFLITSLERIWFKAFLRANQNVIVQTPTMFDLTRKCTGNKRRVRELAFLPQIESFRRDKTPKGNFLYVASFDAHKNFENLIEAWKTLDYEGIRPELILIISGQVPEEFRSNIKNLNIQLKLNVSRQELLNYYSSSRCLIHPSYYESLGIVLIEAKHFELDILAPESDYVRDILDPKETFDPHSPKSIARSVKRYLNIPQSFVNEVPPSELWKSLID